MESFPGLADAFKVGQMYEHVSGNKYECVHIRHGDSMPYHFQSTGKQRYIVVTDDYGKDYAGVPKIKGGKTDKPRRPPVKIDPEVLEKIHDRLDALEAWRRSALDPFGEARARTNRSIEQAPFHEGQRERNSERPLFHGNPDA